MEQRILTIVLIIVGIANIAVAIQTFRKNKLEIQKLKKELNEKNEVKSPPKPTSKRKR